MAYNNSFPVTYQQYYPYQQNNYQQQQSNQNGIIWVLGEAVAEMPEETAGGDTHQTDIPEITPEIIPGTLDTPWTLKKWLKIYVN